MTISWFEWLKKPLANRSKRRTAKSKPSIRRFHPTVEQLESREVPAHFYLVGGSADGIGNVDTSHAGSASDPYVATTLRAAVNAADGDAGSTVLLPAGTYMLTIGANGLIGELAVTTSMTIEAASLDTSLASPSPVGPAIIQQTVAGDRVLDADPLGSGNITFAVTGDPAGGPIIIKGGDDNPATGSTAPGNGYSGSSFNNVGNGGGGLLAGGPSTDSVTIGNVAFFGNATTSFGGAIEATNSSGTAAANLAVTNTAFGGAVQAVGGAIVGTANTAGVDGGAIDMATGQVDDSSFVNNAATGIGGGAISFTDVAGGTSSINFDRFVGNTASTASNGNTFRVLNGNTVNANDNWWDNNAGPQTNDIYTSGSGSVTTTRWLILTYTASTSPATNPVTVQMGTQSATIPQFATLTADFIHDNTGSNVSDPAGNFPAFIGLPVNFNSPNNGTLSNQQTTIQSGGTATATYTGTSGTAGVSDTPTVTVDGVTATTANATDPTLGSSTPITVDQAPTATNPVSLTVNAGALNTQFSSTFTDGTPLGATVVWLISTDGGATFPITLNLGSNTIGGIGYNVTLVGHVSTLTVTTPVTAAMNQYEGEAVFTNGASLSVVSSPATLTVDSAPAITTNPVSVTINSGGTTSFTSAATGTPTPTAQWQASYDGGINWNNIGAGTFNGITYSQADTPATPVTGPNSLSSTLNVLGGVTNVANQYEYRTVFSNTLNGAVQPSTATTMAATLTVAFAPNITTQPVAASTSIGGSASFRVAYTQGSPLPTTVQWQYATAANPTVFSNLTDGPLNGATISGSSTAKLTITNATAALAGDLFRAVVSNATNLSVTSNPAVLSVGAPPTSVRVTQNLTPIGYTVLYAGSSTPTGITVIYMTGVPAATTIQWQFSPDGLQWSNNFPAGFYNTTTNTLTIGSVPTSLNGTYVRAAVSNAGPFTAFSAPVQLIVLSQNIVSAYYAAARALADATNAVTFGVGSQTTLNFAQEAYSYAQQAYIYDLQGNQAQAQNFSYYAYYCSYYAAINSNIDYQAHKRSKYDFYNLSTFNDSTTTYSLAFQGYLGN